MAVNIRKPLTLKNNTKYFDPITSAVRFTVVSPNSYQYGRSRIEGYETRLYFEFDRTKKLGGQTFFYTLTYCEDKIPKYEGHNCFDYEDLRFLLNGGFRKFLLRKYGTTFRYFVGAEFGDGKGSRGLHNNPHYHILFFLRPSENPVYVPKIECKQIGIYVRGSKKHPKGSPKYKNFHSRVLVEYKPIDPLEFRHQLRLYWQGFDQSKGYHDYRDSRYGIVREGKFNLGVVQDFRAISYVSKYCIKDVNIKNMELSIKEDCGCAFEEDYRDSFRSYSDFLHDKIYWLYNVPLNARHTEYLWSDKELCWKLVPHLCQRFKLFDDWSSSWVADCVKGIIKECHLEKDYEDFVLAARDNFVHEKLVEFRNRYSNKVRVSQEVGSSALDEISDPMNPSLRIPAKNGYKSRTLPMYLYRKMYTEVYTDIRGRSTRILSNLGQKYKLATLEKNLEKIRSSARSNLYFAIDREFFDKVSASDVNTDMSFSYDFFIRNYNKLLNDFSESEILHRYSIYKYIYENRFIKTDSIRLGKYSVSQSLDYVFDYDLFLAPAVRRVPRSDTRLSRFLENSSEDWLPYGSLPYFNRFMFIFTLLDTVADYLFVSEDAKAHSEAEAIAKTRRLHKAAEMKVYLKSFNHV